LAAKFRPAGSERDIASPGGRRLKNRIEPLHRWVGSANHHAITTLETPDATAGSHVHVVNAFALELTRAADVIFEIGITAVDNGVARLHVLRQFLHGLLG